MSELIYSLRRNLLIQNLDKAGAENRNSLKQINTITKRRGRKIEDRGSRIEGRKIKGK
jgi:hypothetical protein